MVVMIQPDAARGNTTTHLLSNRNFDTGLKVLALQIGKDIKVESNPCDYETLSSSTLFILISLGANIKQSQWDLNEIVLNFDDLVQPVEA